MRNENLKNIPQSLHKLETAVAAVLEKFLPGVFLASVSGGADSTAMLVVLAAIRDQGFFTQERAFELRCIHIEHGIRPEAESKGDAEFVRSLCDKLCVPYKIVSIKPGKVAAVAKNLGIGIEAAARLYRRRAWFRELRRIKKQYSKNKTKQPVRILTAHTADDMLETVLMRILRGSGPSGLGAMPIRRGRILRPLITLSRRDILDYLSERGIAWREDSTNKNVQFLRNRIRHCLIPNLNEHFPQWRGAITALGETQSLAAKFIKDEVACRIKWGMGIGEQEGNLRPLATVGVQGSGTGNFLFTDADTFFTQPTIIREEALFQGINKLGLPAKIKRKNIRKFAEGKLTAVDLGSLQIRRDSQWVMIVTALEMGTGDRGSGIKDRYSDYSFSPELYPNSSNNNPYSPLPTPHSLEFGFSLLINALGSYNIKGIAIEVAAPVNGYTGDRVFLAFLPLVLRPHFKGDRIINERKITSLKGEFPGQIFAPAVITAADPLGPAAFIGENGCSCWLLRRRDDNALRQSASLDDEKRCVVQVTINANGGIDV